MNKKVLSVLEFDKIRAMLSDHATSPLGKEMAEALVPVSDRQQIVLLQQNTADGLNRIMKLDHSSFGNNKPLGKSIASLKIGITLSASDLLDIAGFLDNCARIKSYGEEYENGDSLSERFDGLAIHRELSEEIHRCLPGPDYVDDNASPGLKSIRRNMAETGEKIQRELNSIINGRLRTYLQEPVITTRSGRYCIPVKVEYKGQVPGLVHDHSGSGSTLFIEPQAIVELNNKVRELELMEQQEIEKILEGLSAAASLITEELLMNQQLMTELDFIFAKSRLALKQKATLPLFGDDGVINLRKARHPLLDQDKVVPIDVRLGEEYNLLVVTGPNTGGKTVSLKTVGLLSLMGQAGLHIPAAERSSLAVFKRIYADIGDEQSIEQSLSTFSSHMKNIVAILKNADKDCLCLFDELGAGTDPTEGAALAISILDFLHNKGIATLATTHYSELKIYALRTEGVENACQEFDVDTLSPTYRLLIGVPGKSNAFAISRRLGLGEEIIESAKNQITEEQESFEDVIAGLESSRRQLEEDKRAIEEYKKKIRQHQEALERKQEKIDSARDKIIREAREEARVILKEAKDVADETIKTFRKAGSAMTIRELEQARDKVRLTSRDNDEKMSPREKDKGKKLDPSRIAVGDSVKIISMGMKGTICSLPDAKGEVLVRCGVMNTKVNTADLVRINEDELPVGRESKDSYHTAGKGKTSLGRLKLSKSMNISTEINLLGKTVDEALYELDKYLDDAYLAHLPSVRIVHGKGTGALRQAVTAHLRRTKYVKSYRQGEYGEGDAGVTICEFKE